ncbi:MAG: SPW repeat protein [Ruegeria sp.]|nr:SPW repeat protein [Ruegeria sp.]
MRKPTPPYKWMLAALGIWLVMSPFLLFSQEVLLKGLADREMLAFMTFGFGILLMCSRGVGGHLFVRVAPVVAIGVVLIAMPMVLGFTGHHVAAANAWVCGSALIALAAWEALMSQNRYTIA